MGHEPFPRLLVYRRPYLSFCRRSVKQDQPCRPGERNSPKVLLTTVRDNTEMIHQNIPSMGWIK